MKRMNTKPEDAFPIDLDKAVQLSATGSLLRASISVEQPELDKLIASGLINPSGTEKSGKAKSFPKSGAPQVALAPPVAPPVLAKPVEPVRKTVMIYGLAGGPREIPVN